MFDTKELRTNRAKLIADAQAIAKTAIDAKRSINTEEQGQIDKMLGDEQKLMGDIDRLEKLNSAEQSLSTVRSTIGREGNGEVKANEKKADEIALEAYRSYVIHGDDMPADLRRSLTVAANGTLAPIQVTANYVEVLRDFTDIRQAPVTVIPTTDGRDIPWPKIDDTDNDAAQASEAADVGAGDDPDTTAVTLKAFNVVSGIIKVSRQFLTDSIVPVEQWLNNAIATRIGAKQNKLYTTGGGTTAPQGIVTGAAEGVALSSTGLATVGTTAADTAASLQANFNELIHSVKYIYRKRGNCGFMFHDQTAKTLKNYVDGLGRPLWVPSLTAGQPDQFMGYPVFINDDMDAVAAAKKPVLFGNFSYYYIRDVGSLAIDRLVERYAEYLMVGFNGYHRTDGRVMDSNAIKYLSTHA